VQSQLRRLFAARSAAGAPAAAADGQAGAEGAGGGRAAGGALPEPAVAEEPVRSMLLCGADVVASFAAPGVWREEHLRSILRDHGVVCIVRRARPDAARRCRRRALRASHALRGRVQAEGARLLLSASTCLPSLLRHSVSQ
jgi:hypothetical protein